jgi:hypothetical protein
VDGDVGSASEAGRSVESAEICMAKGRNERERGKNDLKEVT